MLKALDEPPFYYGEERLNIHSTEGGVAIDTQARVLDQSEEPLLGLFAAGETVGNLHGKSRPGGNGVLACVVFGRIAGQEAARLEPLKVIERLQVFCSQRQNEFAFVMPDFHHQGGDSAAD